MLADLVEVITPDGIPLSGAYFAPRKVGVSHPVDAVLFFHGDCGNFYGSLYLGLGERMAEQGIAFLTANRGHDHVANGVRGGSLAGYAFESVYDSRADFGAWLRLLRERGHRRIAIGGHSGGAVRATYAQAVERFADVVAVIPVSPGEYDHEGIIALHGEDFSGSVQRRRAERRGGQPGRSASPGSSLGFDLERARLCGLLQSGQSLQRNRARGEHRLPHALHIRLRRVRRWRAAGTPGLRRRSPPPRRREPLAHSGRRD